MKHLWCTALILLCFEHLSAQQSVADSTNDLNKLKLKSVYLLGSGFVSICAGLGLMGPGIHDMKMSTISDGSLTYPHQTNYTYT